MAAWRIHSTPSVDHGQIGEVDGIDERRSRALAAQLHKIGALAVLVARGSFSIKGEWAGASGKSPCILLESGDRRNDIRHTVARLKGRLVQWLRLGRVKFR